MSRLSICLVAPPYSGHLNPLLGIGRELLDIADVTLVSTPGAMTAAAAAGIEGYPILAAGEQIVQEIAAPGRPVKSNPLLLFRQLKANVSLQADILRDLDEAFAALKPDLVIADFTLPVAGVAAARCGARWWTTTPAPCVFETVDGPPAYMGGLFPARSPWGRLRNWFLRKLTRAFKRLMFFLFRKDFQKVGLPTVYRDDGSERVYSPEAVLAWSVAEIEFPRMYPPHFQFAGASLYTPPLASVPPGFVPGKKHVLVTLGTHLEHEKDALAARIHAFAHMNPEWVFHFTDGRVGSTERLVEGNFHRYGFVSYDDHLAGYDLVVHHGGTGILLHCLKLGIPAVVMPMDFDHFDNAARLVWAGAARRVRRPSELPSVLRAAMTDEAMKQRCGEFRGILAGYDAPAAVKKRVMDEFGR